jgi:hypothetical protein
LIAGPEEVTPPKRFDQPCPLHHVVGVIMHPGKHERTALIVESFVQAVDGFDAGCVDQRHPAHRKN